MDFKYRFLITIRETETFLPELFLLQLYSFPLKNFRSFSGPCLYASESIYDIFGMKNITVANRIEYPEYDTLMTEISTYLWRLKRNSRSMFFFLLLISVFLLLEIQSARYPESQHLFDPRNL